MKESQQTEFKRQWKDEWLKWISAFANAEGGVLMVGYDDRGQVVGVEQASKLLEDVPNKIRDILGIVVDVNLKVTDGLETLGASENLSLLLSFSENYSKTQKNS